jgi:hypothetical protein
MADFITVVFEPELPFLEIQAKSICTYIHPDLLDKIYVVVNDNDDVVNKIDKSWWGKFQDRVIIYPYSIFGYVNRVEGWENQQLCKLLAASRSTNEWSIILDAKTFFVRNCINDLLFFENKACTNLLHPQPVFQESKDFVEKFFSIKLDHIIGPGGVPFFFHTETVKALINESQILSNLPFPEFFQINVQYPNLITEFYLYSGFVKYKYGSTNTLYMQKQRWNCVNIADWQIDDFDQLYNEMQKFFTLTVSVPSKTWKLLLPEQQESYLDLLQKRKIIDDPKTIQKRLNTVIN